MPPVSINDLPDTRSFTPAELAEGVWVSANFWHGSASARVEASINGGAPIVLQRTQEGAGEDSRRGARHADPFAIKRQASVGRWAIRSRSGEERNQGWEGGRGATANTGAPQPSGWADRSVHLWQARLPADLSEGVHTLRLTSTDRNGRSWADVVTFEVRAAHPPPRHRREVWR